MLNLKSIIYILVLSYLFTYSHAKQKKSKAKCDSSSVDKSKFTEELLVRPLPTGHVHSHFEFTTTWSNPGIEASLENYQDLGE